MDKLTEQEVLHVANLAKIKINEDEMEKYRVELKKILDDIEKIKLVEGYDEDRLIAPWSCDTLPREDKEQKMLDAKEVLKNTPRHNGNYIEVPVVIGE